MKLYKALFFIFIFFFSFEVQSQNDITVLDSTSMRKREFNPLAPAKAAFYSAILPGAGQVYNKKYWKVPIVYGALGISVYSYMFNQKKYHEFRDEYKRRLDGTFDPNHPTYGLLSEDRLIRAQKFHQRNRDLSMLITAGIYIFNIIDANVDAHLLQFNIDDDLSFQPYWKYEPMTQSGNLSMALKFKF